MVVNRVVNFCQFKEYILFELEECAGALATQNKNWEGIEKKGTIYERTLQLTPTRIILINNTNNLIQQHCAQNNTLGAQGGFVKDNCRQFNCQLKSIRGCFLFGLEECAWRIGNPKQKLRGDRKKGNYIRADTTTKTTRITLINNTNNLFQQHCAQHNTLGAQGFVKTIVVNSIVNYRQFKKEFCFCSNEMQQCRIWRAKQNW